MEALEDPLRVLGRNADAVVLDDDALDAVSAYLVHDKKNRSGELRFVLLEAPGKPVVDQPVPETLVRQSLQVVLDQCR